MPQHTPHAALVAVSVFVSAIAVAQDQTTVSPVVVTATRTAETADESLSSVTVITREDIERSQATNLPEFLGRVQGLEFTQSGGRGKASSLFIRGTNGDHMIVLIDGVRVGSSTTGTTAFETLPLANIERIEVVRGPRSSLYGSSAIGGVIQIFTRKSGAGRASISAGSHEYGRVSAGYGRSSDESGFSVDFSAEETDGFDACENDSADFECGDEPDDDGFESTNVSVRGNRHLSTDLELSANLLVADSEIEFDGTAQNSTEQTQTAASTKLDWAVTERWQSRFTLGRSTDDSDNFLDETEVSHFDTTRTDFQWQNDFALDQSNIVTAGMDVMREEIDTSKVEVFDPSSGTSSKEEFDVTERETVGVFLQHQWATQRWDTQANLRHEFFDEGFDDPDPDGDKFDDETTGSIAVGHQIRDGLRVFGSYGTAFHAPTFNDLFFPGFANPDLDPEKAETLEIGVRGNTSVATWEVTAYRTEIDDLIAFDTATSSPQNINEAEIQGIEVGVDAAWSDWQASMNADFKDPEDGDTGNQLPRRAKHNFRGSLTRSLGTWTLGADVRVQGERFDELNNSTRLDSYALLDLRANWRFAPDWRASFKVNNVGDTNYTLVGDRNTDERNYLVQVDWRPGASQ